MEVQNYIKRSSNLSFLVKIIRMGNTQEFCNILLHRRILNPSAVFFGKYFITQRVSCHDTLSDILFLSRHDFRIVEHFSEWAPFVSKDNFFGSVTFTIFRRISLKF